MAQFAPSVRRKTRSVLLLFVASLCCNPLALDAAVLPNESMARSTGFSVSWVQHEEASQGERTASTIDLMQPSIVSVQDLDPRVLEESDKPKRSHIQGTVTQDDFLESARGLERHLDLNDPAFKVGPVPRNSAPELAPTREAATAAVGEVRTSFEGISNTGWSPPDTVMAVGATHIMEATNSHFSVFQKNGSKILGAYSYNQFFSTVVPQGWQGFMYDPRVLYYPQTNQFLTLILGKDDISQTSYFFIGISQTGDPSGSWWRWRLVANWTGGNGSDSDSWADYAGLGVDEWGIYLTADMFFWTGGFKHATLHTLSRDMLNGGAAFGWGFWDLRWPNSAAAVHLQPAQPHSIAGGGETFFVNTKASAGTSIALWKMTGDRTNAPSLVRAAVPTNAYSSIGENIDQPGSLIDIDGGDARILNAVYANRKVWTTLTTDVFNDGTRSGIFIAKIDVDAATASAQRVYHSLDAYYFYPALVVAGSSADSNVVVFVNWISSSLNQYASGAALVLSPDLQNNLAFPALKAGEGPYVEFDQNNKNRWGDYSGAGWDWYRGTAWGALEWATSTSDVWSTWISEIQAVEIKPEIFSDGFESGQTPPTPLTNRLNDTGIVWGSGPGSTNNSTCIGDVISAQDCSHGRDATDSDPSDGPAGFSFTKLDSSGHDLPNSAAQWECVRDNITGLIWEVKTNDGGLRDVDNEYRWYNPDYSDNGGNPGGTKVGGSCTGYRCDTDGYALEVNNMLQALCGARDWTIPTREQLHSILNYNEDGISFISSYFPYANLGNYYWTNSTSAQNSQDAWLYYKGSFGVGWVDAKTNSRSVILVRGSE